MLLLVLGPAAAVVKPASGQTRPAPVLLPNGMHPAVVRVMATDRDGFSLGSGTLVAVSETHGLVITNWHVIRDAAGPIAVAFPNGFQSTATVLRTDHDWDLAALAIWRPNVDPVPLAALPPQPGEPLAIAGYGSGQYRTITGRCTQYVSPGPNQPFEMVELSAPARQGDSGGPILNSRGELAGVLFGTGGGQTAGSYCGRVRMFLTSVREDFFRLRPNPALLAQNSPVNPPLTNGVAVAAGQATAKIAPGVNQQQSSFANGQISVAQVARSGDRPQPGGDRPQPGVGRPQYPGDGLQRVAVGQQYSSVSPLRGVTPQVGSIAMRQPATCGGPTPPPAAIRMNDNGVIAASPNSPVAVIGGAAAGAANAQLRGTTLLDDIKNYLAVVGAAAVLFHGLRIVMARSASHGERRGGGR